MARIRSVKPEFFKHELLSELEIKYIDLKIMLTFEGLWTICDKQGVFEWRPARMKLDILPFIDYNLSRTLEILFENNFIYKYEYEGNAYGLVVKFGKHQQFYGKEHNEGKRYILPAEIINAASEYVKNNREVPVNLPGNVYEFLKNSEVDQKIAKNIKNQSIINIETTKTDNNSTNREFPVNLPGNVCEIQEREKEREKERKKERKMQEGKPNSSFEAINEIFKNENLSNRDKLNQLEIFFESLQSSNILSTEIHNDIIEKTNYLRSELQGKEKNSDKKENIITSSHRLCKQTFLAFYKQHKKMDYYWSAKDATQMNLLIGKLLFTIKQTKQVADPQSVNDNFSTLLAKIPTLKDQWIFENLSIPILNSKYNETIDKISNGTKNNNSSDRSRFHTSTVNYNSKFSD